MYKILSILLIITVMTTALLGQSCLSNQNPVIKQITADSYDIPASYTALITCNATDPNEDPLSYNWTADGGTIESHSASASWKAPAILGSYLIKVIVSDVENHRISGQIQMKVIANTPPIIESLSAEPSALGEGKQGTITCVAHDPEGGKLSYSWDGCDGQVSGVGSSVTWTAPIGKDVCEVKVKVADESGNTANISTNITVLVNHDPQIIKLTATPSSVTGGKTSVIDCEASDKDDDPLGYVWDASAGMIAGDGAQISWTAPIDCQSATITATVNDGRGGESNKSVKMSVHKPGG